MNKIIRNINFNLILAVAGFLLFNFQPTIGQVTPPGAETNTTNVEIINADIYEFGTLNEKPIRRLLHNVHLRQDSTDFFCDSAHHYVDTNFVIAYSRVKIIMGDSVTIIADKLTYDGKTKICKLYGNIILTHGKSALHTDKLTYYREESYGYYENGGILYDGDNELRSERGYYYSKEKRAQFKKNVELYNPKYTLKTDTLGYLTEPETALFLAPTTVYDSLHTMYTEDGFYDTKNDQAFLHKNAKLADTSYTMYADSIYYDRNLERGKAFGHIIIQQQDTGLTIYGDRGEFYGQNDETIIFGNPYAIQRFKDDTLVLSADTLFTISDSISDQRIFRAFHHVKFFMNKMQGRMDSLCYFYEDSIMYFFQDPVLWTGLNQILGDTIIVFLKNGELDSMSVPKNGFMSSEEDTLGFNQIKGKKIQARFLDKQINMMWVQGNSESIYWALGDDSTYIGMNKATCNEMIMEFDKGQPQRIIFNEDPSGTFYPVHDVIFKQNNLEGFKWRIKEKPERPYELLGEIPPVDSAAMIADSLDSLEINNGTEPEAGDGLKLKDFPFKDHTGRWIRSRKDLLIEEKKTGTKIKTIDSEE